MKDYVVEEEDCLGAKTSLVGVDRWVWGERVCEDVGRSKALVHPLTAILDLHDAADDLAVDDRGERKDLLCGADVFPVGGVVGHQSSRSLTTIA